MNKKILKLLMVFIILSLALSGCKRAATTAPADAKIAGDESPIGPVATQPDTITEALQSTQDALQATAKAEADAEQAESNAGGGAPSAEAAEPTAKPTKVKEAFPKPETPDTYVLKKGEFPYCIARRYNLNVASLLQANGLGANSIVGPGTRLTLPQSGSWDSGSRTLRGHPDTYTVRSGDTVYSIACLYGDVYPEEILYLNDLDESDSLEVGSTIEIP